MYFQALCAEFPKIYSKLVLCEKIMDILVKTQNFALWDKVSKNPY